MFRYGQHFRYPVLFLVLSASALAWGCQEAPNAIEVVTSPKPASILIFPTTIAFDGPGQSTQAIARVQDQNGFTVSWVQIYWESSDESVVTVSSSGLVKAVSEGEAIVTVTAEHGSLKATASVVVG